ncbi:MAG: AMP-binding protein [Deltaproteobacteria bacterium]|nr:AMP-binding protein [Deltaproteobacteria bacterium]
MDVIGTKTVRDVIELKVQQFGDKEFIVFEDREGNVISYTYRQVDEMINKYANILLGKGIEKGDKVTVHMLNSPEYLFSWFACAKIGAVMIPTNVLSGAFELEYYLEFSESVAIITEPNYMEMFSGLQEKCPKVKQIFLARTSPRYPSQKLYPGAVVIADLLKDTSAELPPVELHNEDDLMWLFTSGTTSRPKAVQLTHANAVFSGIFGAQAWKVTDADRHFIVLPLFHVNGQFISVMPTLTAGATLVMAEVFSATKYMAQVRCHGATTTSLVAATLKMVYNQPPEELDAENNLRVVMYAIAIPEEVWEGFEKRFDVKLCDLWGMTETLGATTVNPTAGVLKRNCIGMPRMENAIKVIDEKGNEVEPGTVGEVVVKGVPGRTIMKAYYNNPEATAETVKDGWLYTGDNAYMDEDGYFHFVDRKKDMIKRSGENVAATEVEYVISLNPKVKEVAVIGVPDPIRDEAIMACVILNPGDTCEEQEIIDWCADKLAKFKVPGFVKFMEDFPRTSIGKVQKNIIKKEEIAAMETA